MLSPSLLLQGSKADIGRLIARKVTDYVQHQSASGPRSGWAVIGVVIDFIGMREVRVKNIAGIIGEIGDEMSALYADHITDNWQILFGNGDIEEYDVSRLIYGLNLYQKIKSSSETQRMFGIDPTQLTANAAPPGIRKKVVAGQPGGKCWKLQRQSPSSEIARDSGGGSRRQSGLNPFPATANAAVAGGTREADGVTATVDNNDRDGADCHPPVLSFTIDPFPSSSSSQLDSASDRRPTLFSNCNLCIHSSLYGKSNLDSQICEDTFTTQQGTVYCKSCASSAILLALNGAKMINDNVRTGRLDVRVEIDTASVSATATARHSARYVGINYNIHNQSATLGCYCIDSTDFHVYPFIHI